jgi:hypothetical protein
MIWKTSENRNRNTEHSGTQLQQTRIAEDRISELEDKIEVKGKTEELLVRQLKTCKRNMQELTNTIKRPNVRIMGIEEGEEVQAKGIHDIFNKVITEEYYMTKINLFVQNGLLVTAV